MANVTPGYAFTEHERPSPTSLHALIESAALNNVVNADLASGTRIAHAATPGSPITGDLLIGSDFLLDLYYSAAFNGEPDDAISLTLLNDSGSGANQGCPVLLAPTVPTRFHMLSQYANRFFPIGVTAAFIGAALSGSVVVRGTASVRVLGTFAAGDYIRYNSASPGQNCVVTTGPLSDTFAMALESGGTGGVVTLCSCRIFQ